MKNETAKIFLMSFYIFIAIFILVFGVLLTSKESYKRGFADAENLINSKNIALNTNTFTFNNELLGNHIKNVLPYIVIKNKPDSILKSYNYLKEITKQ
jgi:hypothetical protein